MSNLLQVHKVRSLQGFTMVEVVVVLLVLAVLATTAVVNVAPERETLSSAVNAFRANLRYAQSLAMSQAFLTEEDPSDDTVIWGLAWGGSSYQLQIQGASQNHINLPGTNNNIITLPGNAQFSGTGNIQFNYRGQPVSTSETVDSDDTTITLTEGGLSQTVTVVADTGFVQ